MVYLLNKQGQSYTSNNSGGVRNLAHYMCSNIECYKRKRIKKKKILFRQRNKIQKCYVRTKKYTVTKTIGPSKYTG